MNDKVKQLWEAGKTLKQICTETGMGKNKVLKILQEIGE